MESYQDVKREGKDPSRAVDCYNKLIIHPLSETIRRMFYNWLNKARSVRHLRVTLQEREEEVRIAKIAVAWDKWRDRFKDERLRTVVSFFVHYKLPGCHAYAMCRNTRSCSKLKETCSSDLLGSGTRRRT